MKWLLLLNAVFRKEADMVRPTFDRLPKPISVEFLPSKSILKFESEEASEREDLGRLASLASNADMLAAESAREARSLRRHLKTDPLTRTVFSLASSRDMRVVRDRLLGSLAEALDDMGSPLSLVTLIPHTWRVPSSGLLEVDGKCLINQAVEDLRRAGSKGNNGGLIGFLEAEYDASTDVFAFHMHLIVWGDMLLIVERLRTVAKYAYRPGALQVGTGADHPVRVDRVTGPVLPAITYILKSHWVCRVRTSGFDGVVRRTRCKHRIAEPLHSEVLLWLHRHRLDDLCLKINVKIDPWGVRVVP